MLLSKKTVSNSWKNYRKDIGDSYLTWKRNLRTGISEEHEMCLQEVSNMEKYLQKQLLEEERKFNKELRLKDEQMKLQVAMNEES